MLSYYSHNLDVIIVYYVGKMLVMNNHFIAIFQ